MKTATTPDQITVFTGSASGRLGAALRPRARTRYINIVRVVEKEIEKFAVLKRFFVPGSVKGENAYQGRRRRNEKNEKSEWSKRKPRQRKSTKNPRKKRKIGMVKEEATKAQIHEKFTKKAKNRNREKGSHCQEELLKDATIPDKIMVFTRIDPHSSE